MVGRGTGTQKSLKLINVGNKSHDAQKVNKGFLKHANSNKLFLSKAIARMKYWRESALLSVFFVNHIIDCLLSNQGQKSPGKFGPAYCSNCSRVTLISKPIHFIIYGGRHLISMQEIQISMREIQNPVKFQHSRLLQSHSKLLRHTLCFLSFKKHKYQLVIYIFSANYFNLLARSSCFMKNISCWSRKEDLRYGVSRKLGNEIPKLRKITWFIRKTSDSLCEDP